MKKLPAEFVASMQAQWGEAMANALCDTLCHSEPSVSIRLNPAKPFDVGAWIGETADTVPWCPLGHYLSERPAFVFDPLFHAGAYYVQDASAMFLWHLLQGRIDKPIVALDLCAAPGGKSTLLRNLLPKGSHLVSNEPVRQRAQILAENMCKWGSADCVVTCNFPADFSRFVHQFDLVVADVPCSGEGMFRKDDTAIAEWSLANVANCVKRQRDIIETIWPALKSGGLLVYSTCTFNRSEDEEMVQWICTHLGAEELTIEVDPAWSIVGQHYFLPGRTRGEGQYMTLLRKQEDGLSPSSPLRAKLQKLPAREAKVLANWLQGDFDFYIAANNCRAIPSHWAEQYEQLSGQLHIMTAGVEVASMKGRDWQPAHGLAMTTARTDAAFAQVELSLEQALKYLHRETICIEAPKGFVLVSYQGHPLGFVKNLGSRANNLYPDAWRIRKGD